MHSLACPQPSTFPWPQQLPVSSSTPPRQCGSTRPVCVACDSRTDDQRLTAASGSYGEGLLRRDSRASSGGSETTSRSRNEAPSAARLVREKTPFELIWSDSIAVRGAARQSLVHPTASLESQQGKRRCYCWLLACSAKSSGFRGSGSSERVVS